MNEEREKNMVCVRNASLDTYVKLILYIAETEEERERERACVCVWRTKSKCTICQIGYVF